MSKWLVRGLVFAALMVVVRLVQGALINQFETKALMISVSLLAVFAVVVFVWGLVDGRADARATPDPDRREDLAMTWLVAGLIAGLVSGVVCWVISLVYKALYVGGLVNEVTTFAAFTALLVFLPAIVAVAIGRWLIDRNAPEFGRKANAYHDERADTDVFAAVRDDERTVDVPPGAAEPEPHASSVAVAERDEKRNVVAGDTEPSRPVDERHTD
jgi:hypothetical protein